MNPGIPPGLASNLVSSPTRVRKRARKACESCRSRKVRCDVSIRGCPCMNCSLDGETCVVTGGRSLKLPRVQPNTHDVAAPSLTSRLPGISHVPDAEATEPDWEWMAGDRLNSAKGTSASSLNATKCAGGENNESLGWIKDVLGGHINASNNELSSRYLTLPGRASSGVDNDEGHTINPKPSPDVLYCHYPFLVINNMRNIPPHDLNFLELQGCLRVPTGDLLYELVQQYFLHVHPILPLVNEGDFWDLYFHCADDAPKKPISLLVFQAILFASCNFISSSTVHALGFPSVRVMRASYYRHAKLLYDLGSESSPLSIAQASLLLSFASLSASRKPNISWLSIAIENAKIAEAHLYASIPITDILPQERNLLKRVWWCCIIRDRSTGLLMRRPIQISKLHFSFAANPLCAVDLADEFERSSVYDPPAKRELADVLAQWTELNIALTDILMLVFPLDERRDVTPDKRLSDTSQLSECKLKLERWYKSAVQRFSISLPDGDIASSIGPETDTERCHSSVILYTNLMLMYYHTARVVLSHYEVLQLDILQKQVHVNTALCENLSTIVKSRQELEDAAFCITEIHKVLVHRGLDRWLPVSAIGCTALPLILHILDNKLAPQTDCVIRNNRGLSGQKEKQLNVLIQVMKTYQSQYDGVDWVTDIVRHIINLAQLDDQSPKNQGSGINWTDILVFQPSSYLRLTLVLDLSLRKGRLAEDGDFPVSLRGLFAAEVSPLKDLVKADGTNHIEEPPNDYALSPRTLDPSALLFNDEVSRLQEQSPGSGLQGSNLEDIEEQIYLHLAGGMTDKDMTSSHDSSIFDL
ncbi:hypothetical protein N7517_010565 [Penicillium concentricum]|uniref:Zn(2)-C6 fungal-type domain-containing protein n=1 Tax=Penicillium concentricum TaxID=293559 RepID=A0A9W9R9A7_9EURO|nr:uncharacterized protein N7517_010565 [Penicillium concentricum]KAJ5355956.1 hypothetical protein N7517_010565 [Penicillium concentricum]